MKKILFVLAFALSLVSCDCNYTTKSSKVVESVAYVNGVGRITYIEFDGHQYVKFNNGETGSLCHSPKCPCLEQYKKSNSSFSVY